MDRPVALARLCACNRAHSDEFFCIFAYRVRIRDVFPDIFTPDRAEIVRVSMSRALTGDSFKFTPDFGDPLHRGQKSIAVVAISVVIHGLIASNCL